MSAPPLTLRSLSLPRRLFQGVLGAGLMALSLGCYLAVLKWRGSDAVLSTQTAWDEAIPFWPAWLYVYLAPYAVGPVLFALLRPGTFAWLMTRGLLTVGISLVIFAALPTRTERPKLDGLGDGLTADCYRSMAGIDDPPGNAAPSLHVSLSCLLAFALCRDFPRWWPAAAAGIGLIWLATLFTWQHHLIDVGTGALLALAVALPWPKSHWPR
ncbi:MAG TPA: phosphatase PAP2 family protein [Gemmataceae bacterium]|nr:phosphatase PAP2 family protein [Gemmataceae bacterium]